MHSAGTSAPRATAERRHFAGGCPEDEALSRFDLAGPTTTFDSPRLGTPAALNLRLPVAASVRRRLGGEGWLRRGGLSWSEVGDSEARVAATTSCWCWCWCWCSWAGQAIPHFDERFRARRRLERCWAGHRRTAARYSTAWDSPTRESDRPGSSQALRFRGRGRRVVGKGEGGAGPGQVVGVDSPRLGTPAALNLQPADPQPGRACIRRALPHLAPRQNADISPVGVPRTRR